MNIQLPPKSRLKKLWATLLAGLILGTGTTGCHYTTMNKFREQFCLAPSLYHNCPQCGKFTAKGLPHCCECAPQPAFNGFQATCWNAWPSEWQRCPAPNSGACANPQEFSPIGPMDIQGPPPGVTPVPVHAPTPAPTAETNQPAPETNVPEPKAPEPKPEEAKLPPLEKPSVLEKAPAEVDQNSPPPPTLNSVPPAPPVPRSSFVPPPNFEQPLAVEAPRIPEFQPAPASNYVPSTINVPAPALPAPPRIEEGDDFPQYDPQIYGPTVNEPSPSDRHSNPYETTKKAVAPTKILAATQPAANKPTVNEPTPVPPPPGVQRSVEYQAKREPQKSVLVAPVKKPLLNPTSIAPAAAPAIRKTMELPAAPKPASKPTLPTAVLPSAAPQVKAAPATPTFKTSVLHSAKISEAPRSLNVSVIEPEAKPIQPTQDKTTAVTPAETLAPIVTKASVSRPNKITATEAKHTTVQELPAPTNRPKLSAVQVECAEPVK
jgi:hypothetical protein